MTIEYATLPRRLGLKGMAAKIRDDHVRIES